MDYWAHGSTAYPLQKGVKHLKKYEGDAKQPKTNTNRHKMKQRNTMTHSEMPNEYKEK